MIFFRQSSTNVPLEIDTVSTHFVVLSFTQYKLMNSMVLKEFGYHLKSGLLVSCAVVMRDRFKIGTSGNTAYVITMNYILCKNYILRYNYNYKYVISIFLFLIPSNETGVYDWVTLIIEKRISERSPQC